MKNALIVALGLVGAALILSSATSAERTFEGGGSNSGGNDSVPVDVQNFPASQEVTGSVDIRTFPHTVNVQGTVDVGNLPATQNVAGTVDVGNLPLDAEGRLRVAGAPISGPAYKVMRLPDMFVSIDMPIAESEPFDVAGWGQIQVYFHVPNSVPDLFAFRATVTLRMGVSDFFVDPGGAWSIKASTTTALTRGVSGALAKLVIIHEDGISGTIEPWLYLSN